MPLRSPPRPFAGPACRLSNGCDHYLGAVLEHRRGGVLAHPPGSVRRSLDVLIIRFANSRPGIPPALGRTAFANRPGILQLRLLGRKTESGFLGLLRAECSRFLVQRFCTAVPGIQNACLVQPSAHDTVCAPAPPRAPLLHAQRMRSAASWRRRSPLGFHHHAKRCAVEARRCTAREGGMCARCMHDAWRARSEERCGGSQLLRMSVC